MEKSLTIINLAKALVTFHIKVDTISRDAANPFFKSRYASLNNILSAIKMPLAEAGLSVSQFPTGENGLTTILMHAETGEFIQDTYEMKPVKNDPQGRGSAITYQRRYAIASILSLNIDEDDDGNEATHGVKTPDADAKNRPWLNKDTDQHKAVIHRLTEGTADLETIKKHYRINKEMEAQLRGIKPKTQTAA